MVGSIIVPGGLCEEAGYGRLKVVECGLLVYVVLLSSCRLSC